MAEHTARVEWARGDAAFVDQRYSRRHTVRFDGGVVMPGSSSPHVVAVPMSDPHAVDPEETFVASLSSCHMLWFLAIAASRSFVVDAYTDDAIGVMGRNADGQMAMLQVTLRPAVRFSGDRAPSREQLDAMHDQAHHSCYIANSVRTTVTCEPRMSA